MINRQNYLDIKAYLQYLIDVKQVQENTKTVVEGRLKCLLKYADDKPFPEYGKIKPTFQIYMEKQTDEKGALLSASYLGGVFKVCRGFLYWAKYEFPSRYKHLDNNQIEAIRPTRARRETAEIQKREIYTLDDVLRLANYPATTNKEKRMQAATVFLFLSGMRITAFLTMPIRAFDIQERKVLQLPALGVKTKNSKAAETYLLPIPELMGVVREWDNYLRSKLPDTATWFPLLDNWGEVIDRKRPQANIRVDFRKQLIWFCDLVGVPYKSPHKFRHGHAVWALKRAENMSTMKAISQNLMHSNMGITDGIYGRLVNDDVKNILADL